ncbi:hypothetical protein M378DRAFT_298312 [Amanita muscaria Koide BX008]|uniref:Uncharacterized protein n=1 Tax=Amanita muscaria (strain Koide BX008) TaxID=946122 RepID=A0A0C2XEI4_AMAMK|nr:hypothetical protein M378DRAFT_298312 [Amanita muscaria Koide BX008]
MLSGALTPGLFVWLRIRKINKQGERGLSYVVTGNSSPIPVVQWMIGDKLLCSIGGLITADSLRDLARPHRNPPSTWPRVVACLSFDTPFFGTPFYQHYMTLFGMGLQGFMAVTEPLVRLMTGPVGLLQSLFDTIQRGTSVGVAAYPYLEFLQELQDDQALQKRVDDLISFRRSHGVQFTTLYVALPTTNDRRSRTFVKLPSSGLAAAFPFLPIQNGLAKDATEAIWECFLPEPTITMMSYAAFPRISYSVLYERSIVRVRGPFVGIA